MSLHRHLQPWASRFRGPEAIFGGEPLLAGPRIILENGERVPLHGLGYVDSDTGAITEWKVPEGDIISYVWDNEKSHFEAIHKATRGCTPRAPRGSPNVFLDVGANHGLFGFMAAARGCIVEFYDPQVKCADLLSKTTATLPYRDRIKVVGRPVGDPLTLSVAYSEICAGRYEAAPGQNDVAWNKSQGSQWGQTYTPYEGYTSTPQGSREVTSLSLDEIIAGRRIACLKVDVESFEASVLRSGARSFAAALVDVLIVEVSTQTWTEKGWNMAEQAEPFLALIRAGYRAKILRGREALGDPGDCFAFQGAALSETNPELLRADLTRDVGQRDYMFVAKHVLEAAAAARAAAGEPPF